MSNSQSLACSIFRAKYLLHGDFLHIPAKPNSSFTWRNVLKCRELLRGGIKWLVGDGNNIHFWYDWWVGKEPLVNSLMTTLDDGLATLRVADVMTNDNQWNLSTIQQWLPPTTVLEILAVPLPCISGTADCMIWGGESSGLFSASSAYMVLYNGGSHISQGEDYAWIWSFPCTERMRFFLWLLFEDKLNTNQNRARRRMTRDMSCAACQEVESAMHLFRDYPFAVEVWHYGLINNLTLHGFFQLPWQQWIRVNCSSTNTLHGLVPWRVIFVSTLWVLWHRRNALVFSFKTEPAGKVWFQAQKMARELHAAMGRTLHKVQVNKWVSWKAPLQGMVILNSDGATKTDTSKASV